MKWGNGVGSLRHLLPTWLAPGLVLLAGCGATNDTNGGGSGGGGGGGAAGGPAGGSGEAGAGGASAGNSQGGSAGGGGAGGGAAGIGGAGGAAGAGGAGGAAGAGGVGGAAGAGGAGSDPTWGCLNGQDPTTTPELISIHVKVVNATSREPLAGARVRACGLLDANCQQPVLPEAVADAGGEVAVSLPGNFSGYFEVRSPAATPDLYVPELVILPKREFLRGGGLQALLFKASDAEALAVLVGGSFDLDQPSNVLGIATALDCTGANAPGVSFAVTTAEAQSPQTKSFYTDQTNLPTTVATETSASGTFGLTNLKAGLLGLSATVNAKGQSMGNPTFLFTRNGWVSLLYISPHYLSPR